MRTIIAVLLLISTGAASARPMHVMASTPAAQAIMSGGNAQYVVRFDGPIDHAHSTLEILRDGQVLERLRARLDSAPDVLFASAPALQPGNYALHWTVRSMPDQDDSDGMIPFSVAR
jgi:methionine-rich copper-binding protein CopC